MSIFTRVIAILLTIIVIPLLVAAACNSAITRTLHTPETYAPLLEDEVLFEEFIPAAVPAIISAAERGEIDFSDSPEVDPSNNPDARRITAISQAIPPDAWRDVANSLIPPEWIQQQAQQGARVLASILEGDDSVLDEIVNLDSIRERWQGEEAVEAASIIITTAPTCTRTEIDTLNVHRLQDGEDFPICNPEDPELQTYSINTIETWLNTIADTLPEENPTVASFFEIDKSGARQVQLLVSIDRQLALLSYLCPLALLALIVVLSIRSLKTLTRWFGIIWLLAGISVIVFIVGLQLIMYNSIVEIMTNSTSEVGQFFSRLMTTIIRSATTQSSNYLLSSAGLFLAIGFILIVIAWFITHRKEDTLIMTETGEIISTATQRRIGRLENHNND